MNDFLFSAVSDVLVGAGTSQQLGDIACGYGYAASTDCYRPRYY